MLPVVSGKLRSTRRPKARRRRALIGMCGRLESSAAMRQRPNDRRAAPLPSAPVGIVPNSQFWCNATGLVIVLRAFDSFATLDRRTAYTLLDIFADQARCAILIGNRIICLVQSNDPQLSFGPVGKMPVMWNDAEWLNSRRCL